MPSAPAHRSVSPYSHAIGYKATALRRGRGQWGEYRTREWHTGVGTVPVAIPKLRKSTYFPSFLEARRSADKAMIAVIQEAYVHGVSTRSVDDLVRAMGMTGISKSQVSRLCEEIDGRVKEFL